MSAPVRDGRLTFSQRHTPTSFGQPLWTMRDLATLWERAYSTVREIVVGWERDTGKETGWWARRSMRPLPDGRMGYPLYEWRVLTAQQVAEITAWRLVKRREMRAARRRQRAVTSE